MASEGNRISDLVHLNGLQSVCENVKKIIKEIKYIHEDIKMSGVAYKAIFCQSKQASIS